RSAGGGAYLGVYFGGGISGHAAEVHVGSGRGGDGAGLEDGDPHVELGGVGRGGLAAGDEQGGGEDGGAGQAHSRKSPFSFCPVEGPVRCSGSHLPCQASCSRTRSPS